MSTLNVRSTECEGHDPTPREPGVLGEAGRKHTYHICHCKHLKNTVSEVAPISQAAIEWHELDLCEACLDRYTP